MILALIFTMLASLLLPVILKPLLLRLGVIDVPGARSSHTTPAVRGMGLSPLLAMVLGYAVLLLHEDGGAGTPVLISVVMVSLAAGVVGWIEDYRGLPVAVRACAQFAIGIVGAILVSMVTGSPWWMVPMFAFGIAAYINVANFMDGINGISGLHGVIAGAAYALIGLVSGHNWMVPAGFILATAFLGFLPWNLVRGGIFLGDVGSYLLGAGVVILAVGGFASGLPLLAAFAPLTIYIADTGVTLVRRILSGQRWYQAHRTHVYQRLTDVGFSHVQVACIVAAGTAVSSIFGFLILTGSLAVVLLAAFGIVVTAGLYLALPRLTRVKRQKATRSKTTPGLLPLSSTSVGARSESRWAVVGASGFIGSALALELRNRGHTVVEVSAPRVELAPSSTTSTLIEGVSAETTLVESLVHQFRGVDVVVNAAGLALPDSAPTPSLFGANALLPVLIANAAIRSEVPKMIHLSSAAVQGRCDVLDESPSVSPFSPYSRSKALGEAALLSCASTFMGRWPELIIVRATSVQGQGRSTTRTLVRFASSALASVAKPGDRPTVVSSVRGLVEFLAEIGDYRGSIPTIVLQPWEGLTTSEVLEAAGSRSPIQLPLKFCQTVIALGYAIGARIAFVAGLTRRVELMWMGQRQNAAWARSVGLEQNSYVRDVFAAHR